MIEAQTKSGIKFTVDERIKDDARAMLCLTDLMRYSKSDDAEKMMSAMSRLMDLIFGGMEGKNAFFDAVADAHDGICNNDTMSEEFSQIMECVFGKNS